MWKKKNEHDRIAGDLLPIPTQIVSNEEYFSYPPDTGAAQSGDLAAGVVGGAQPGARPVPPGVPRRQFRDGDGLSGHERGLRPLVFGCMRRKTTDLEAYPELWPKNSFVFDVQTHHVRTGGHEPLFFRKLSAPFNKELAGMEPQKGDLQFRNFVKEVFLRQRYAGGGDQRGGLRSLQRAQFRRNGGRPCPRQRNGRFYASARPWAGGAVLPEFSWRRQKRHALELKVDSWKFYPGVVERKGEFPFWMDDEKLMYPFLREDSSVRHEPGVRPQGIAAARKQR